jgi:hypothetical protein
LLHNAQHLAIDFLEKDLTVEHVNGKIPQRLSYMRVAAERGAKLIDQLLSLSRSQRLEPRSLNLNEPVAFMRGRRCHTDLCRALLRCLEASYILGVW